MCSKNDNTFILRHAKKIRAISLLGGKCINCSNNRISHLEFHHTGKKENKLNEMFGGRRWSDIEKEIVNCKLLCANCHSELHFTGGSRTNNLKEKYLELKNVFRCMCCGYKGKSYSSLTFHHTNPKDKLFGLGDAFRFITDKSELIAKEIEKCDVICINCHRDKHFNFERFNFFKDEIYSRSINHKEIKKPVSVDLVFEYLNNGFSKKNISDLTGYTLSAICQVIKRNIHKYSVKNFS